MYPPADDNYGSESCSIIALGGIDTPTLVVIASASAALYHCLLLPNVSMELRINDCVDFFIKTQKKSFYIFFRLFVRVRIRILLFCLCKIF